MKKALLFLVVLLSIPTFFKMIRPGIYSMQDFHYFRLVEFGKCTEDNQIPCRWSSDSGLGFGEPLFNFYGQTSYVLGEITYRFGLSYIDSLKFTFIISIVGSGIGMFFLAKKFWKDNFAALTSSILYMYAPYRAVDVWVRGALPEAMSFIFFPLIILFFENYLEKRNKKQLLLFCLSFALLVLTHNLSVILFLPFLVIWISYRLITTKNLKLTQDLILSFIFSIGLAAFYLLPVIFESKFVNIESTTQGYFNFRGHFIGISQILFSRFWGYGGSVFGPEDGLNLSLGLFQWFLPIVAVVILGVKKKINKELIILLIIGLLYLGLTHNKSTPLWEILPFMKYIQFPWRFLGVAVFAFSLAGGVLIKVFNTKKFFVATLVIAGTILWSVSFFREDIWYSVTDNELTTGQKWEDQTRASISDYWPKNAGPIPTNPAPTKSKDYELVEKKSNRIVFKALVNPENIDFPVNDFPGWIKTVQGNIVTFEFTNTPIRNIGNIISLLTFGLWGYLFVTYKYKLKKNEK